MRDRPDVSYTELEFDAATETGKTRLIFMLDEKAALPIPADELHDEDPDLRARQQAFRKRLGEAGLIVRRFSSPEQLETELFHALKDTQEETADDGTAETWELRGHRPDPYFTGRDGELEALHQAFRAKSAASAVQVISGLGGLGKTRLAVEYAWRYAPDYELVWWIRAEDSATMRGDYAELAGALGLPSEQDDQAIAALRQELRRRRNWLLVFDNAEEPSEPFSLLPERHQGHVLITSRRRDWPHTEDRRLEVLSAAAAVGYLQRRGRVADAGTARDLAEALGCLPLALETAAGRPSHPAPERRDTGTRQPPPDTSGHLFDYVNRQKNYKADRRSAAKLSLNQSRGAPLGPDHPDTLNVTANLAATLRQGGQLDQARALQEQVFQTRRQVQGQEHRDTILAMIDLARTLYAQENKEESRSLLAEALTISLRVFGKTHTTTTDVAWQMVLGFKPHEASRRNAFIMQNLSWLSSASPDQLTGEQKGIKNGLKRFLHGGRPKDRKKKK